MDRKQTAWKKSRKFGDIYGGRERPKMTVGVPTGGNRIFRRAHSILPPSPLDKLPIYIVDNPSRDFFFPSPRQLKPYAKYTTNLSETSDGWYLEWTLPQLKNFYIETLLYHEIGHHIDCYRRRWTPATHGIVEEYANQYAFERTSKRRFTYSHPTKSTCES